VSTTKDSPEFLAYCALDWVKNAQEEYADYPHELLKKLPKLEEILTELHAKLKTTK
jgi:hypothetical protein